jgi:CHAT domain-containing protein
MAQAVGVNRGLVLGAVIVSVWVAVPLAATLSSPPIQKAPGQMREMGAGARLLKLAMARRLLEGGTPRDAEPVLTTLLAEADAAGDHQTASLSEGALGRLHSMIGDEAAAATWYAAAEARAKSHHLMRPLAFVAMLKGNGAYGRGDREGARAGWQQALSLFEQLNDYENQSYLLRALAFVSPAERVDALLTSALELSRRSNAGRDEGLALYGMAEVAYSRGQWSRALTLAADALPLVEAHGSPIEIARMHLSLARLHRSHGNRSAAVAEYRKAHDGLSSIERGLGLAQAWAQLATGWRNLGDLDAAVAAAQAGVRVATSSGSALDKSVAVFAHSDALLMQHRNAEALAAIDALSGFDRLIAKGLTVNRATALSKLGRHAEAMAAAAEASGIAGDLLDQLPHYAIGLAEIRWRAGDRTGAVQGARDAVAAIERLRQNAASVDQLRAGFDEGFQTIHARLVRMLFETGGIKESLEATERARARAFADLLASRELPAQVDEGGAAASAHVTVDTIASESRRLRSTTIAYWTDEDGVAIWVIDGTGLKAHRFVKVPAARLANLVQRTWDTAEPLAGAGRSSAFEELHALLIAPIQAALPAAPGARLTIVPHGPLFRLSFAGLQGHDQRHVIERFAIHYVPSIGASVALAGSDAHATASPSALIVAAPELDAERRRIDSLRPLPGAGAEGDAVARALGVTSTTLTRRRATEREVRTLAPTRRVLHFATHAVASDTEPMDSFLALAGSSSQPSEDGRLTAEEVYGLSLDADLVVLSGCRTASGQITGDGVVGLSRAFFVAGTPSIVASLWDLPDAAGEELLPRFYRQWSRSADKADALRQAQLQMLERMRTRQFRVQTPAGPIAVKPHPAVWAGLVLLGEP